MTDMAPPGAGRSGPGTRVRTRHRSESRGPPVTKARGQHGMNGRTKSEARMTESTCLPGGSRMHAHRVTLWAKRAFLGGRSGDLPQRHGKRSSQSGVYIPSVREVCQTGSALLDDFVLDSHEGDQERERERRTAGGERLTKRREQSAWRMAQEQRPREEQQAAGR